MEIEEGKITLRFLVIQNYEELNYLLFLDVTCDEYENLILVLLCYFFNISQKHHL